MYYFETIFWQKHFHWFSISRSIRPNQKCIFWLSTILSMYTVNVFYNIHNQHLKISDATLQRLLRYNSTKTSGSVNILLKKNLRYSTRYLLNNITNYHSWFWNTFNRKVDLFTLVTFYTCAKMTCSQQYYRL
jgi:hypothetical protein